MRPDGSMIVEIVRKMVRHKVLAGCPQIDWIPPLKLCFQSVKYGLGQTWVGRYRSVFEVDVVPDVKRHVFRSVKKHSVPSDNDSSVIQEQIAAYFHTAEWLSEFNAYKDSK